MKKMMFVAVAALAVAACGDAEQNAGDLRTQAGATIDEGAVAAALRSAVDEEALEGLARGAIDGAVQQAVREVLPVEEMAFVGAVVDEEALVTGLDSAVDREALSGAARGAIGQAADEFGLVR